MKTLAKNKITVPPIKSQGIKTKLVPWINDLVSRAAIDPKISTWIEPFFGTGVVGFNAGFRNNIVGDTNPHIINFYTQVQSGCINQNNTREYLAEQDRLLQSASEDGYEHYRFVRDKFNTTFHPLDFMFLSRAGFNGMMRFNSKGRWNIPFCKKPNRFAPAYITKICNQISNVGGVIRSANWEFCNQGFLETIEKASESDIIYCDPPYYGRYVDYYNGWTEDNEEDLFKALAATKAKFVLSTWHHNNYRENEMVSKYWKNFNIITKDHFYHSGAKLENRQSIVEALVFNFDLQDTHRVERDLFTQI